MKTVKKATIAFSLICLASISLAQDTESNQTEEKPDTELKVFGNWTVQCIGSKQNDGQACALFTQVTLENGQRLLSFQVRQISATREQGSQNFVAIITVPLGVHLPSGMQIRIDDTLPLELGYERCDQGGCYAGTTVGESLSYALKAGKDCVISFSNLKGKTIKATLSLNGFTAGFNAL